MAEETNTWGYPYKAEDWGNTEKGGHPVCCSGKKQSPIDLPTTPNLQDAPMNFMWQPQNKLTVKGFRDFGGHSLTFFVEGGSSVHVNGKVYELVQFHFHTGSEHTINGQQDVMEGHWVHSVKGKPVDVSAKGDLAVVGVMYMLGDENPGFTTLLNTIQGDHASEDISVDLDMMSLLPPQRENVDGKVKYNVRYWSYGGSLTTPPLSEIVAWNVFMDPVTISPDQLSTVQALSGFINNFRPPQPLNNRELLPNDNDLDKQMETLMGRLGGLKEKVDKQVANVKETHKIIEKEIEVKHQDEEQQEMDDLMNKLGKLSKKLEKTEKEMYAAPKPKENKFLQCLGVGGSKNKQTSG